MAAGVSKLSTEASYFEDCEIRSLPFGKRQDIPFMFMWSGSKAVEMWVIISDQCFFPAPPK
eukprot:866312-Amphidinium_carterae.1